MEQVSAFNWGNLDWTKVGVTLGGLIGDVVNAGNAPAKTNTSGTSSGPVVYTSALPASTGSKTVGYVIIGLILLGIAKLFKIF